MSYSLSLGLIMAFLKENNLEFKYVSLSRKMKESDVEDGVHVKINEEMTLSIQTHPLIVDDNTFAETAVLYNKEKREIDETKCFTTSKELFDYINSQ